MGTDRRVGAEVGAHPRRARTRSDVRRAARGPAAPFPPRPAG
ncbi:hypothetical protein C7S17_0516 [Burkholderia thailandensis]|nr:hypothetical protein [Burkholderia thailandensis]